VGQVSDDGLDLGHKVIGREGRTPDPLPRMTRPLLDEVGASDPEYASHRLHCEPA
jgi:hypothetical protein